MDFIVLILGLAMLIFGAEGIVRGSVSLAKHLQISLFAIGAVVVAAGTSLPELANCIRAVIMDHSDIAVGAVVGSNIANVALIMGTTTILCPILLITSNQLTQGIINILIALGIIILSWFSFSFNMIFGIISILLLITIMFYLIKNGRYRIEKKKNEYILVGTDKKFSKNRKKEPTVESIAINLKKHLENHSTKPSFIINVEDENDNCIKWRDDKGNIKYSEWGEAMRARITRIRKKRNKQ